MSTRTRTLSAKDMANLTKDVNILIAAYEEAYTTWFNKAAELGAPKEQLPEKKAVRKLIANGTKAVLDAHEKRKEQLDRIIYFLPGYERRIKEPAVEILGNRLTGAYMRFFSLYCDYLESERMSYSDLRSRFG
jgi:hypothetical protein